MSENMIFSIIMYVCCVPALLFCYYLVYSKKWEDAKVIFGVRNRDMWKSGPQHDRVEQIVKKYQKQAKYIVIIDIIIASILLAEQKLTMIVTLWMVYLFAGLIALYIPYIKGNAELKAYKCELGIKKGNAISYVDLTSAGTIYAVKKTGFAIPLIISMAFVIVSLLWDFKVFSFGTSKLAGTYVISGLMGTFAAMNLLMYAIARIMDRQKNLVISMDSTVNANYNRARKKVWADMNLSIIWVDTVYMLLLCAMNILTEMDILVSLIVYVVALMVACGIFTMKIKRVESRYKTQSLPGTDDDDSWIFGLFYYNPNDRHTNVEKRNGTGSTINMATPVGKVITAILAVTLIGCVVACVWIGMLESTPIQVYVENDTVVCYQLRNEYEISMDEIEEAELLNAMPKDTIRTNGVGLPRLLKGKFTVDGVNGCQLFLNPEKKCFIKLKTAQQTYYIGADKEAETQRVYEEIVK